jgi:hypothetical protein
LKRRPRLGKPNPRKPKHEKIKAESKIDVIPNRAERPVRACPELAEGSLLSHHPSQPHSSEKKIQN